jgi:opacity protein-like surface antigen
MNRLRAGMSASGVLLLVLCGPFSAPPAHAQETPQLAAPPPGKALVFVFRSDREPRAAQVPVVVNAQLAGNLANGVFLVATVDPGRTFLRSGDRVLTSLMIEAAADRSYFVRLEAVHGMIDVQTEMRVVSEVEGRSWLAQGRLPAEAMAAAPGALLPRSVVEPVATQPAVTQPMAAPRESAYAGSGGGWRMALIARGGSFKLAQPEQFPSGLQTTFEAASKPAFGIEVEGRSASGFAAGGEVFYYKNDLVLNGTALSGQQAVAAILVNAKYYYRPAGGFSPYVGAGVGSAAASYGGDFTGKASGPAFQAVVGIEFRSEHFGFNVQYKELASTIEDDAGLKLKVGGRGVLAGLSIIF